MKLKQKRKLKLVFNIFASLTISILVYYLFSFKVYESSFQNLCTKYYCLELIDFSNFCGIMLSIVGLYFVVDSLDSWKDQQAYYNSRDFLNELNKYLADCEYRSILEVMHYISNDASNQILNEENKIKIKGFLPSIGIGSEIDKLKGKIRSSAIHFEEEFIQLHELIYSMIKNMKQTVDNQKFSYKNLDSNLHIAVRNDLIEARSMKNELENKLSKLVK